MTGAEMIAAERSRQLSEEHWSFEHDDQHDAGELAMAAVCYAATEEIYIVDHRADGFHFYDPWPWEDQWDKRPVDDDGERLYDVDDDTRIRALVKAGALLAAEIDRLQRCRAALGGA